MDSKKLKAFAKLLKQVIGQMKSTGHIVGDAEENWVTLSNGAAVQLDNEGNIVKGMGGNHKGENVKEAAKQAASSTSSEKGGSSLELKPERTSWGKASSTPSGLKKSELSMRDKNALSNARKFSSKETAERTTFSQKYVTNVLTGESGQFWVPATHREESILKRLGYKQAD